MHGKFGVWELMALSFISIWLLVMGCRVLDRVGRTVNSTAERLTNRMCRCYKEICEERKESERKRVVLMEERERKERNVRAAERKEGLLREFALRESPTLWQAVTRLREMVAGQKLKERELKSAIEDMGLRAEQDSDLMKLIAARKKMELAVGEVLKKVEKAYIQSKRYEAEPSSREMAEISRLLENEGADEADAASRRYCAMTDEK